MKLSRCSSLLALAGAIALAASVPAPAAAQTKLKMVLNWKYQGPQGWFFLAEDKGYFKRVDEIRLTRSASLAGVMLERKIVGALDDVEIVVGPVLAH